MPKFETTFYGLKIQEESVCLPCQERPGEPCFSLQHSLLCGRMTEQVKELGSHIQ